MRTKKSEEVVFGKGFVPVLIAFFAGTEEEIKLFGGLLESGGQIQITIGTDGKTTFNGSKTQPLK
jgi:hypothetical protein